MEKLSAKTLADIEAFEKIPIQERIEFFNTWEMIKGGGGRQSRGPGHQFFLIRSGLRQSREGDLP
jgi:hypothetical protein